MKKLLPNEKGLTLIDSLIAAGILSISVLGFSAYVAAGKNVVTVNNRDATGMGVREILMAYLNQNDAWLNTLNHAANWPTSTASFGCFHGYPCPAGGGLDFKILNAENRVVFDPYDSAHNGFTESGKLCGGAPSVRCPIKPILRWNFMGPGCPAACTSNNYDAIVVNVRFDIYGAGEIRRLRFSLVRHVPISLGTTQSNDVLGGSWTETALGRPDDPRTYSSAMFTSNVNDRGTYVAAWIAGGSQPISTVTLTARMASGVALGFPQSYRIYITTPDNTAWMSMGSFTTQPGASGKVKIDLGGVHSTYGVLIVPETLGVDDYNNHYFQLQRIALN